MKKSVISLLAAAGLVMAMPAFAAKAIGGGTVAPQETLQISLNDKGLNLNSRYNVDCIASVASDATESVRIKFSADGIMIGPGYRAYFGSAPSYSGVVAPGQSVHFGGDRIDVMYGAIIVINASDNVSANIQCTAKMS